MVGWMPSGALLLLLMAAAALCHPFRRDAGPRSFLNSHHRPHAPLEHAHKWEFAPQRPVAGEEDVGQSWTGHQQAVSSSAENVPDPEDSEEPVPDSSTANNPEVSGSLPAGGPGASSFGPYFPPPQPAFQPGELFRFEKSFEHGDYESERETQGLPQPPRPRPGPVPFDSTPESAGILPPPVFPPPISRPFVPYPFDYYFLTGQYPPGTATHISGSFERGRNYNQDFHYEKYEDDYEPDWSWEYSDGHWQLPVDEDSHEGSSKQDGYYVPHKPGQEKLPAHHYQKHVGHH
ncbi:uncharacterized protein LOC133496783 isoform X2 [Syngnathoides biaculeatus]|uniref:uncharacterized protein LOC133496783 isoform X2 n=1 Tax=Syngnathoides biaculeatus TaxID=300417 RepID=UPI002ADDB92B|nr:uncharacterized protein LOC133496783 isoform X2 [Syngnathoides biaculeatus]